MSNWPERINEIIAEHPLMREGEIAENIRVRLRELFIQTIPGMLAEFEKHAGNSTAVARTAHSIKGAAGFVNARRVWALAGELESHAKTISAGDLQLLIKALSQAYEETKVIIS